MDKRNLYRGKIRGTEKHITGFLIDGDEPFIVGDVIDSTEEYIVLEYWWPVERNTIEPIQRNVLRIKPGAKLSAREKKLFKEALNKSNMEAIEIFDKIKTPVYENKYETLEVETFDTPKEKIEASIKRKSLLQIVYEDSKGVRIKRKVEPISLKDDALWGYDLLRDGIRMFKLIGIKEIEMTNTEFEERDFSKKKEDEEDEGDEE